MHAIIQIKDLETGNEKTKTIKNKLKTKKNLKYTIKLENLRNSMNEKVKRHFQS